RLAPAATRGRAAERRHPRSDRDRGVRRRRDPAVAAGRDADRGGLGDRLDPPEPPEPQPRPTTRPRAASPPARRRHRPVAAAPRARRRRAGPPQQARDQRGRGPVRGPPPAPPKAGESRRGPPKDPSPIPPRRAGANPPPPPAGVPGRRTQDPEKADGHADDSF